MKDPKWTIYNNTVTWEKLSDKKKGKLLLAEHNKEIIKMVAASSCGKYTFLHSIKIDSSKPIAYRAAPAPAPVKAGPAMARLFEHDWYDCLCAYQMIAKGWKL